MEDITPTDWTSYYNHKKNPLYNMVSSYTQRFTLKIIIDGFLNSRKNSHGKICELGGGNSCFAENLCKKLDLDCYDIVDSNELSVMLFNSKVLGIPKSSFCVDLLAEDCQPAKEYDFVYSIGLIEHFRGNNIDTVIKRHFDYCKSDGTVLISFPTPTRKYCFWRGVMERAGVWQFTDEEALPPDRVIPVMAKLGSIQKHFLNDKLALTQYVVIAKKLNSGVVTQN